MAATEKFIDIDGRALFYRVIGSGEPVVLLHGFAEDGTVWQHQVEALEATYRLIVPDLPGSGRSGMGDDMSMEGLAAAIKQIVTDEVAGDESFVMIGHSMGGYVTLAFAALYPDQLKGIGLFHSTAYADTEEKKATRQKGIEFILQHGAALFIEQTTPNLFSPSFKQERPAVVQEFIERYSNFPPESLVQYYESMMARPDRTAVLEKSTYPVLFIAGEYDTAVPPDHAMQQSHLPLVSYIHLLKQSAHMGMLEERELSNKFLLDFLANV